MCSRSGARDDLQIAWEMREDTLLVRVCGEIYIQAFERLWAGHFMDKVPMGNGEDAHCDQSEVLTCRCR